MSIQERLGKLNLSQVGPQGHTGNPRAAAPQRSLSFSSQPSTTDGLLNPQPIGNMPNGVAPVARRLPPAVPSRPASVASSASSEAQSTYSAPAPPKPANPTRSLSSTTKSTSTMYYRKPEPGPPPVLTVRAPVYDPSSLPALPPTRDRAAERRPSNMRYQPSSRTVPVRPSTIAPLKTPTTQPVRPGVVARVKSDDVVSTAIAPLSPESNLPPPIPSNKPTSMSRPTEQSRAGPTSWQDSLIPEEDEETNQPIIKAASNPSVDPRLTPQTVTSKLAPRSALSFGFNNPAPAPQPLPKPKFPRGPPPVPGQKPVLPTRISSNNSAIYRTTTNSADACLKCRDFSAVDTHATRFPRQSLPSSDLKWLAEQLCSPFDSPTDKARAIYKWLAENIAYNADAFFSGNIQSSTPASTLRTGLAVCEGYASLFAAIAIHAQLDCLVVSGHGKGYGFKAVELDAPLPPPSSNHAWNAVRLDDGAWHLIDATWGAGSVTTAGYSKNFNPALFTNTNEEFGFRHFPSNGDYFFRADGRRVLWPEYIVGLNGPGEDVQIFGVPELDHGLATPSFRPVKKHIATTWGPIRFEFTAICKHYDVVKHGKGLRYPMLLKFGTDPKRKEYLPLQSDGFRWWMDLDTSMLGAEGEKVTLFAVRTINGKDARGMSDAEAASLWGKPGFGMVFAGVSEWLLV